MTHHVDHICVTHAHGFVSQSFEKSLPPTIHPNPHAHYGATSVSDVLLDCKAKADSEYPELGREIEKSGFDKFETCQSIKQTTFKKVDRKRPIFILLILITSHDSAICVQCLVTFFMFLFDCDGCFSLYWRPAGTDCTGEKHLCFGKICFAFIAYSSTPCETGSD